MFGLTGKMKFQMTILFKNQVFRVVLVWTSLCWMACNPGKKLISEGQAYEKAGMTEPAIERYERAYYDHGNVEAHIALKRMAESKLSAMVSQARMARMSGQFESAMDKLTEAYHYSKSKAAWGLAPAENLLAEEKQVREEFVIYLIDKATDELYAGNFESARSMVDKAYRFDRNNAKLQYLELMLEIYPNYLLGKKAMDSARYRDAYRYFAKVTDRDPDFKDASTLKEVSVKEAAFTVAFVPSTNSKRDNKLETAIASAVKQEILELKSPFIHLLDRQNLQTLLLEQQNSMDVLFDEALAQKAGKLVGAEYIIIGELLSYENRLSSLKRTEKRGYLGATTKAPKVKYNEAEQHRALNAVYKFAIIKTETGRVFGGGNIPVALEDRVRFAEYQGDYQQLYPGDWKYGLIASSIDKVYSLEEKKALEVRFKSRTEPISAVELEMQMMKFIGMAVAKELEEFVPEK